MVRKGMVSDVQNCHGQSQDYPRQAAYIQYTVMTSLSPSSSPNLGTLNIRQFAAVLGIYEDG